MQHSTATGQVKKSSAGAGRRCRSWCRASWSAQGLSCASGDPCGAAQASRPRQGSETRPAVYRRPATRREQPAAHHLTQTTDGQYSYLKNQPCLFANFVNKFEYLGTRHSEGRMNQKKSPDRSRGSTPGTARPLSQVPSGAVPRAPRPTRSRRA